MYFLIAVGLALLAAYWVYQHLGKKQKTLRTLKNKWGQAGDREHQWENIYYYHNLKGSEVESAIDYDTWADLDMNTVFSLLDRTESGVGQQVLLDIMKDPVSDQKQLDKRKAHIDLFEDNEPFRLELQLLLGKLSGFGSWKLPSLMYGDLPELSAGARFSLAIPFIVCGFVGLGILVNPMFFWALALIPIVNMLLQYATGEEVAQHAASLSALSEFLSISAKVAALVRKEKELPEISGSLDAELSKLKKLRKRVSKYLNQGRSDDFASIFWDYLNMLFLINVNMYVLSVRALKDSRMELRSLFSNIGYLDAMISAASFRAGLECWCVPEFRDDALAYRDAYHPLLEEPVPNSIEIGQKGVLITGSNMSGKSTFLKTLGINQLLAQTFNFCCAGEARLSFVRVTSSMRREDDIAEGKSFYLGEVERVKKLIDSAGSSGRCLILLDEIFRGTNTLERIAASEQVLRWLHASGSYVFASTHDVELTSLLDESYEFYHFTEDVTDEALQFDYKIRPGFTSTRNALKLLRVWNYPDEIIEKALDTAEMLERSGFHQFEPETGSTS